MFLVVHIVLNHLSCSHSVDIWSTSLLVDVYIVPNGLFANSAVFNPSYS